MRNKFTDLQTITNGNVDIVSILETKLDASFPFAQFTLEGYHTPYHLDINNKSGAILVYVKSSVPSRCLSFEELCISIQAIPFEINLRKKKRLVISLYRPSSQNSEYFLNSLTKIIDYFANIYDNHLILGDFNLEPTDSALMGFLDSNSLTNLIKTNTCFKGKGSCIDLILTNRKFSFKFTSTYETGISDHHHIIYTMLKSCFQNTDPKLFNYRDFKSFSPQAFEQDLSEALTDSGDSYNKFKNISTSKLNKHAPKNRKWVRGNHKPHINKKLRKAIMKRSRLKNKANKTKRPIHISNFKKQGNYVVNLNKQAEFEYFSSYNSADSKPFWVNCKPYFSNKYSKADTDIVLNENDDLKNEEIAKTFNDYLGAIFDNLDLHHWEDKTSSPSNTSDKINDIIKNHEKHPSICNIKTKYRGISNFSFRPVSAEKVKKSFEILRLTELWVVKY